ncbi:capsular polysaccharide biosynthesis protein [Phaeovulum sp. W22_SRMD_FR3]|uniref:capsular polysaccharide biosynthesis protein n=1 Tax=Phaeovulum sp. W22_SRMD_FR3 TaxID=3240274 RepID=UPI003F9B3C05
MSVDARDAAAGAPPRRLFVYNGGFVTQPRLRRILTLAGYQLRFGLPGPDDQVGVWGRSPYAHRGEAIAARRGAGLVRIEDAFLRSVQPGRLGEAPLGLLIDPEGVHFDSKTRSRMERLLARERLDDSALLQRARDGMARLKAVDLSKYNNFDPELAAPAPGYVLVVDQTAGDASIRYGAATAQSFREMLAVAQIENPGARIVIKTHPETRAGLRAGHYTAAHASERITLLDTPVSPWRLLDGAIAVYTVSSQLGLEAIFAGHKPRVFGQPFYGGWGLTQDENPVPRRTRVLTRAQLFAVAYLVAPTWYDPCRDRLCSFEAAVDQLEAQTRAWREDRHGHVAFGMRLWKRKPLQQFFGGEKSLRFAAPAAAAAERAAREGRGLLAWAGRAAELAAVTPPQIPLRRVEDGFLRSRGLGADLVAPLSLVTDRRGIYYDPTRPSDLETLIATPPPGGTARIERLMLQITRAGLTKYNLGGTVPELPEGHRILVPGQVEDDASIRLGTTEICTNLLLLARVRAENPEAIILFKPHPDVEAGLRPGALGDTALRYADMIVPQTDVVALMDRVEEVWTMTSTLGFEALLRGKKVTCLGAPFYAGWGLTRDLGPVPARRQARPDLAQLAHAVLIAYPRYRDPVSGLPCPAEVVAERLASGRVPRAGLGNRLLAKLQGALASRAHLWR